MRRQLLATTAALALLTAGCAGDGGRTRGETPVASEPPGTSQTSGETRTPGELPPSPDVRLEVELYSWGFSHDGYSETLRWSDEVTVAQGEAFGPPADVDGHEFTYLGMDGPMVVLESNQPVKESEAASPMNAYTEIRFARATEAWTPSDDGGEYYSFTVVE